jgi:hypothetical protein
MNKLKTAPSCEVDELIKCIAKDTGKDRDEVKKMMLWSDECLYPNQGNTFVTTKFGREDAEDSWLMASIYRILDENGIESIYIITPI